MRQRSYNQFCTLAMTLDAVGERWTLLVIRELLSGPKRYTDLLDGLPGIGTNLLSKRLKDMEQFDLITWRRLPPPAASAVYELTDIGQALEPAIAALSQWGAAVIAHKRTTRKNPTFKASWAILGMKYLFNEEIASEHSGTCELRIDSEVMHVTLENGVVTPRVGPAESPTVVLTMSFSTYKDLLLAETSFKELVARKKIQIEGSRKEAQVFYDLFVPALNIQMESLPTVSEVKI